MARSKAKTNSAGTEKAAGDFWTDGNTIEFIIQ